MTMNGCLVRFRARDCGGCALFVRLLRCALVAVVAAAVLLSAACENETPSGPPASTASTPGSVAGSTTGSTAQTPSPSAVETPDPITSPESEYTDSALASMVAAVSVNGQQPQVMDAQEVRWSIASLSVSPDECAVLITGLASAAKRGLPVAMGTIGTETDRYTITVVGADDATRERVVTDRKLASKRCSKLSTVYGDPAGSNTLTTEWVVRQGDPAVDLEDVVEVDLTTDSGAQQRVIAGRLGNVLIQVTSQSTQPGGGAQISDVAAAVGQRVRASQGSASPAATPTPAPSDDATPSR